MSWLGAGIGALFGLRSGNILVGIVGAVIGNWLEQKLKAAMGGESETGRQSSSGSASKYELNTLAAISAMMAKLAKSDGRITADEVRYCEQVFDRLGLQGEKREFCIRVFRTAKNDSHSIFEYADSFADAQPNLNVREIVYDILWDLACVDGVLSAEEIAILYRIVGHLRISPSQFTWQRNRRGMDGRQQRSQRSGGSSGGVERTDAPDPYEVLGVARSASDDAVKSAYRAKAKALHPDVLRAQGLSDELMGRANEQMARINAAWSEIKKERGI